MNSDSSLVWIIPNGFDSRDPAKLDLYSCLAVGKAVEVYRQEIQQGRECHILIPNSTPVSVSGYSLRQALLDEVRRLEVPEAGIQVAKPVSFNGISDAESLWKTSQAGQKIFVVVYARCVSGYMQLTYESTARFVFGGKRLFKLVEPDDQNFPVDSKSSRLYNALALVAWVNSKSRVMFMAWRALRAKADSGRSAGFTVTVTPALR